MFADITTIATGGPHDIAASIAQITPNERALPTTLSSATTTSASKIITQFADTTTCRQGK